MVAAASFTRFVPAAAGGRLTLTSGSPVTTGDVTGASTIYYEPWTSGRIALKTGNYFIDRLFASAAVSVAVPATLFRPFDVFAYWTGSAVALETSNWNQSTVAITSCTNATPVVLTVGSGHGIVAGDLVAIGGVATATALNGHLFKVASTTSTTITLQDSQAAGAGTGGTLYKMTNTRATGLTFDSGNLVKSGDATRRYLGTLSTWATSGQVEDSATKRLVWNHHNRVTRPLVYAEANNSWTPGTSWQMLNKAAGGMAASLYVVTGEATSFRASSLRLASNGAQSNTSVGGVGIALDDTTAPVGGAFGGIVQNRGTGGPALTFALLSSAYSGALPLGVHAIREVERMSGGTPLLYGDNGDATNTQGALVAEVQG